MIKSMLNVLAFGAALLILGTIGIEGTSAALWLMNQPSDLAILGGVAVLLVTAVVVIVPVAIMLLGLVFQLALEDLNDEK